MYIFQTCLDACSIQFLVANVSQNSGPNTNGCQFFITTAPCTYLNGKHVVFGKVKQGMEIVRMIENTRTNVNDRPIQDVAIAQCGEM